MVPTCSAALVYWGKGEKPLLQSRGETAPPTVPLQLLTCPLVAPQRNSMSEALDGSGNKKELSHGGASIPLSITEREFL